MDTTTFILLSLVFGMAGFGYITFGRRMGLMLPAGCGVVLMICPYFISSALVLIMFCLGVMAVPFFVRDV